VRIAERIQADAYKIHSADLSNPKLLTEVAATGKRIDLSVGASTLDEITQAVDRLKNRTDAPVWLMYGMQNFPTPTNEVHLGFLLKLKHLFELPVGYQDHSDADSQAAFFLPAMAVGSGVDILEKHITHDRSLHGVDHEAALNPDEFARFVKMVRDLEAAWGISTPKPFTEEEMKYRRYAKKSIVAARDLPGGTRVKESDLKFMFADRLGLPPDRDSRLIGKITRRPIPGYQLITEDDVR
jgi:sialic acid synthase SpsE